VPSFGTSDVITITLCCFAKKKRDVVLTVDEQNMFHGVRERSRSSFLPLRRERMSLSAAGAYGRSRQ